MVFEPDGEMVPAGTEEFEELLLEGGEVGENGRVEMEGRKSGNVEEELRQQAAAGRRVA